MAQLDIFSPRPGIDYPRDLVEFPEFFTDEERCRPYLERLRWQGGFVCRSCGRGGDPWRPRRDVFLCCHCRADTRETAGTIFAGTRKPLRLRFFSVRGLTSQNYGANALGLQRPLRLRRYTTAWSWLPKLRRAMVRPARERLCGTVEVDETYVAGVAAKVNGRLTIIQAIVATAVQLNEKGFGRIRLRHLPELSAQNLLGFVSDVIEPVSVVQTHACPSYSRLPFRRYKHVLTLL